MTNICVKVLHRAINEVWRNCPGSMGKFVEAGTKMQQVKFNLGIYATKMELGLQFSGGRDPRMV